MTQKQQLIEFKITIQEGLERLEEELMLANPASYTDEEHDFLIKKCGNSAGYRPK